MALWRRVLIGREGWKWPPAERHRRPRGFIRRPSQAQRCSIPPSRAGVLLCTLLLQTRRRLVRRMLFCLLTAQYAVLLIRVIRHRSSPSVRLVCPWREGVRGNMLCSGRVIPSCARACCRAVLLIENGRGKGKQKWQFVMARLGAGDWPASSPQDSVGCPAPLPNRAHGPLDPGRPRRRTVIMIGIKHSDTCTVHAV